MMKLLNSSVVDKNGKAIFEQSHTEPGKKVIRGSMKEVILQKACEIYGK